MSPDSDRPILELIDATKSFGDLQVLQKTNLTVNRGDYLAIMGESGSGKSTLLNLLGLLDRPSTGQILVGGADMETANDAVRSRMRGRTIGFVFQAFHLLNNRNVVENVELGMLHRSISAGVRRTRALDSLARVGLDHRLTAAPNTLSGGERQRVAIARALAAEVDILLADEPTGNLDSATGNRVLELFDELHKDGLTIVMVTHSTAVAARATEMRMMIDGRLEPGQP